MTKENDKETHENADKKKGGYTFFQQQNREVEKKAIAKYVVDNILKNGMSVFLDAGSTVKLVGSRLFKKENPLSGLTIMTNNMLVFEEFTEHSREMNDRGNVLALTGGVYNQNHEALFGQAAEQVLNSFNPKVVIIGASGFRAESPPDQSGAFHHDLVSEVVTKKAIVSMRTLHRVILCDYSKIGIPDASCFATIEDLANNTEQLTIVTSVVPSGSSKSKGGRKKGQRNKYQNRYESTFTAMEKIRDTIQSKSNVEINILQVDEEGKKKS